MWARLTGVLLLSLYILFVQCQTSGLTVNTVNGPVQGVQGDNFRVWKGIPFGQANRWEAPLPAANWGSTPLQATNFGSVCPQAPKTNPQNEDCLYINVWSPLVPENNQLYPVMFFIYGGGFFSGAGSYSTYDGEFLTNMTNTVLVTFNYRLGALGWLAGPQGSNITGNYGLLDQQLALQWVQQNIQAFGGDPNNVTIFGQSAGAMSVMYHLCSPGSAGLFHHAIQESNPPGVLIRTPEENIPWFNLFANEIGCLETEGIDKQTACLFNKTIEELIGAQIDDWDIHFPVGSHLMDILPWIPIIDGVIMPGQPLSLFKAGTYNHVPTIIGNVANETASFLFGAGSKLPTNLAEYEIFLKIGFTNNSKAIFDMYPAYTDMAVRDVVTALTNDLVFTCPSRYIAQLISPSVPTYRYIFDHSPTYDPTNSNYPDCWAKPKGDGLVCHSAELPFVFHTETLLSDNMTPEEVELSFQVLSYWTSFANSTFNSLPSDFLAWPAYTVAADDSLVFSTSGNYVAENWRASYCDFWNNLGYYIPSN